MEHLWEKPLDFQAYLFINSHHFLIGDVFKLHAFHVYDQFHLVNPHLVSVYHFLGFLKLDSPCVLKLFDKIVYEQICRVV